MIYVKILEAVTPEAPEEEYLQERIEEALGRVATKHKCYVEFVQLIIIKNVIYALIKERE